LKDTDTVNPAITAPSGNFHPYESGLAQQTLGKSLKRCRWHIP